MWSDPEPRSSKRLTFDDGGVARLMFGPNNANLQCLERISEVTISSRGTEVSLAGQPQLVSQIYLLLEELYALAKQGRMLKCIRAYAGGGPGASRAPWDGCHGMAPSRVTESATRRGLADQLAMRCSIA